MRDTLVRYLLGILVILALALSPAFSAAPENAIIDPERGIGLVSLGMTADRVLEALWRADFEKNNDDGTILYEWGLLTQGDLPDATLWVLIDDGTVAKVGTDGGTYRTPSGLGVGSSAEDFVKQYGFPAENPAPGFYMFRQGIGIAIGLDGGAAIIWVEAATQQSMRPSVHPMRSPQDLSDEELMQQLAAGRQEALGTLYSRYASVVLNLAAHALGRCAAEEVARDVFLSVWRESLRSTVQSAVKELPPPQRQALTHEQTAVGLGIPRSDPSFRSLSKKSTPTTTFVGRISTPQCATDELEVRLQGFL